MDERKYHIDGIPASAMDIIHKACNLDHDYNQSGFYTTSEAALILRKRGHDIGDFRAALDKMEGGKG
jgi:hypothetical protein